MQEGYPDRYNENDEGCCLKCLDRYDGCLCIKCKCSKCLWYFQGYNKGYCECKDVLKENFKRKMAINQERKNEEFQEEQKLREKFKIIASAKKEEWLKSITIKPNEFFENKKVKTIDEFNEEIREEWEKFKKQEEKKQ